MHELLINNREAYIIGGAIRDTILGIEPHDWDIFTNATGEELLQIFPKGKVIGSEDRQAKILTVIVDGVEVSQYRANGNRTEVGNNLEKHLSTCDFNVNAIACDIEGNIIDKYDGERDILQNTFRFVGKPIERISEDPLRLLRGIRLICNFGLHPDYPSREMLIKHSKLISDLPQERVRDELLKLLKFPNSIETMDKYKYIKHILPELYELKGLDDGPHHDEDDCFNHSVIAFKNSCDLTNNVLIRLAVLLHDIGKKPSSKIIDGEITFHNHELYSEKLTRKLMRRLKFSNDQILYVSTITRLHMMGPVKKMRDSTFAKICDTMKHAKIEPEDMVVMTYSDNQANLTKVRLSFHIFLKENPFLRKYYEFLYSRKPFNKTDLEINGNDIIKLGVKPGPEIGKILQKVFDAVYNGETINRRDKLLEYVKQTL